MHNFELYSNLSFCGKKIKSEREIAIPGQKMIYFHCSVCAGFVSEAILVAALNLVTTGSFSSSI
jgi:hypothetical protein